MHINNNKLFCLIILSTKTVLFSEIKHEPIEVGQSALGQLRVAWFNSSPIRGEGTSLEESSPDYKVINNAELCLWSNPLSDDIQRNKFKMRSRKHRELNHKKKVNRKVKSLKLAKKHYTKQSHKNFAQSTHEYNNCFNFVHDQLEVPSNYEKIIHTRMCSS